VLLKACLEACFRQGVQTQRIAIADLKIHACRACHWCAEHGRCVQRDDMEVLYDLLATCDGLVLAAPIFFYGLPAQVKAVIDRCQVFWNLKYRLGRPIRGTSQARGGGVFLSAAATQGPELFTGAVLTVKYFFDALNLDYAGDLLVRGLEGKGEAAGRTQDLDAARALGRRLLEAVRGRRERKEN
jgi:multimeric flavodoxin WrbA